MRSLKVHLVVALAALLTAQCGRPSTDLTSMVNLSSDLYFDKVYGAWQATMFANHIGLAHEGLYLDEPSPAERISLQPPAEWSTDDDTAVEWVDLHIMETYGLDPSYEEIRDEWVDHLNHDIWVSTRQARDLMDEGFLPPETGSAELNPDGVWSIDAQLQTELFGLIAPAMPEQAQRRAKYFARVTNSGFAVEAAEFYAVMYALAFVESEVEVLLDRTAKHFSTESPVREVYGQVVEWHAQHPNDWRMVRRLIRDAYDTDPEWWAAKVNFASTIMAILFGEGDLIATLTIANLAGWDADNNATTSVGMLGVISGHSGLPTPIRAATETYYNEDVTGDLPRYQTVLDFARRTQALTEKQIIAAGGEIRNGDYGIPQP